MSIYPLYKEVFPPTVVDSVVCASFTSPSDVNVIVARTSILQIYKFVEDIKLITEESTEEDENNLTQGLGKDDDQNFLFPTLKPAANPSSSKTARLELVAQYKLFGNVASMGVMRTISSGINGMDSLLLSFKDAKMSLLEWSLATNSIVTISIHYYEREEFKTEFLANTCPTELRVDPSNRCAVLNFYGNKLAILPFRQEDTANLSEEEIAKIASNFPYLQSIVFDVSSIDSQIKIKNIIDMEFLYGCHEPTLAILFESYQTWPGKSNSIKDTCSVITMTLDISKRKYPVVFTRDTLPQTCLKIIPVPDSMGVIIIAADAIIYIDDSSLGIGIAVNTYTSSTTKFPLDKTYENLGLSLEGSCHVILDNNDVLLSLSDGGRYVVKLIENEETVTGIRLERAGHGTSPSCACRFSKGYFILGSRLGDSHLIKYYSSKKDHVNDATNRIDNSDNSVGASSGPHNSLEMSDYKFIICDTLVNVGPIVDMAFGELAYPEEESQLHIVQKNLEIVTCSGYNDESSLCIFHRNINPIVNNSFPMEDCTNIWTISCRDSMFAGISVENSGSKIDSGSGINSDFFDKYLFISKKDKTMVLGCGEELQELQQTDFYTDGPTINVGCLLNGTRILQVYDHGLRFVDNEGKLTQLIPIDEGLVVFASIVDPYVLLLFDNGDVSLMKVDERTKNIEFHPRPERINAIPTVSCCIYRDDTELFSLVRDVTPKFSFLKSGKKRKSSAHPSPMNLDDDEFDDLCKGFQTQNLNESIDATTDNKMEIDIEIKLDESPQALGKINEENVSGSIEKAKEATYWCTLFKQDGSLEIFKLSDFEEVFLFPHFDLLPAVLVDFASRQNLNSTSQKSEIKEILLINLGKGSREPYLITRTSVGDIIIYKAYQYIPGSDMFDPFQKSQSQAELSERLAIRFSRVSQEYISRETIYSDIHDKPVSKRSTQQEPNNDINQFDDVSERQNFRLGQTTRNIIPFSNIGGYNGVFIAGVRPAWLLIANNNFLRLHPMSADGEIKCFTQFHNVHCKQGFLYANHENVLRLSELSSDFRYDMEWPIKKIPLRKTGRRTGYGIEYHAEMQVYALATSIPVEFILRDENGDPINDVEQDRDQLLPETLKFMLELISPVTWETVDSYDFMEDEQILCIKCVNLQTKSTSSGRKSFIAVGTGFFRGEDVGMRGNVYVFEIIEVVPEPDNPQTNHKYKLLCHEEVKGSVTAICDVKGYLLTCVGPKIFIRAFEDNDRLISVAFIDIQIYGNSVVSVKDYILLGDVYKSVWFLGFQEEPAKLILIGKDYHSLEVSCLNYLIDEPMLYIVVADMDKNVHLFQYAPYNVQSFAGQKLIRRGDFHIGAQVKTTLSLPKKELIRNNPIEQGSSRYLEEDTSGSKLLCLCGTLDGSISIITPIPERMYKRLQLLHSKMVNGIQHVAGLNPKAFRLLNSKQKLAINPAKGILDGDLLFQFQNLATHRQKEMTKHIGTTVERIIDDLLAVQESCDYF